MKVKILLVLVIMVQTNLFSQLPTIPNHSFENWTEIDGHLYPDNWIDPPSTIIENGVVYRKSGGSDGSYSIHYGSTTSNGNIVGTLSEIQEDLTSPVGGLTFELRIQNNNSSFWNGAFVEIYFYDANHNQNEDFFWSSPTTTNYGAWTNIVVEFESPSWAVEYQLQIGYLNYGGNTNEYCEFDNIRFIPPTGLNEVDLAVSSLIYPNPTSDLLYVDEELYENYDQIKIFNSSGTLVHDDFLVNMNRSIDVHDMLPGMYFVRFISEEKSVTQKLIIQ